MFGPSGVQNMTSCMKMPIFVSFPEFLGSKELMANNSKIGLDPNPKWEHQPTLDVEPMTGAVYKSNNSLQLNTIIHSVPFEKPSKSMQGINEWKPLSERERILEDTVKFKDRNLYHIA